MKGVFYSRKYKEVLVLEISTNMILPMCVQMSTRFSDGDDNEVQGFNDGDVPVPPVLNLEDRLDVSSDNPPSSGKSSQTPHSALTSKRGRSEVWDHFTKKESNGNLRAHCSYCPKHFAFKSSQGTSTLHAHLARCSRYKLKHPEISKQKTLPSIIESKGTRGNLGA